VKVLLSYDRQFIIFGNIELIAAYFTIIFQRIPNGQYFIVISKMKRKENGNINEQSTCCVQFARGAQQPFPDISPVTTYGLKPILSRLSSHFAAQRIKI